MTTYADPTRALVEETVRTGLMITGLLENLLDLPDDAFPGERRADVLLDMLSGTIARRQRPPAIRSSTS